MALVCGCLLNACQPPRTNSGFVQVVADAKAVAPGTEWGNETELFQRDVLSEVGDGDRLLVAPIDANSYSDAPVFDETFPAVSIQNVPLTVTMRTRDLRNAAVAAFGRLGLSNESRRTEIVGAILAAGNRFETSRATRKVLVIISSGFEQSGLVNMADVRMRLAPGLTSELIRAIRARGELPSLSGVDVCFGGITAGENGWAEQRRLLEIGEFWRQFFMASGARLRSYGAAFHGCVQRAVAQ